MAIRGGLIAFARPKEIALRAVVTRADGTCEDRGIVAYYHENPLVWLRWRIRKFFNKTTP